MQALKELAAAIVRTVILLAIAFTIGTLAVSGSVVLSQPVTESTIHNTAFKHLAGPTEQEIREVELKCKTEYDMAFYIQKVRITTGDDWETFEANVKNGYHPGEPLGHATTEKQIAIKDRFYENTLKYADFIYHYLPRGWAPDKVADVFVDACIMRENHRLRDKYGLNDDKPQKFNI